MSCFEPCEFCDEIAEKLCSCSSPPRFCCDKHISNHTNSRRGIQHPLEDALVELSKEEIDSLKEAAQNYQNELIREAVSKRNKKMNSLLQQMKRINQEYNLSIERILDEEYKKIVSQLVSKKSLPKSSSPFIDSLVSLKISNSFSASNVYQQISSCFSEKSKTETHHHKPQWELFHQIEAYTGNLYLGSDENKDITCISVSECDKYFASGGYDKTIKIWDAESSSLLRSLEGHTKTITSISFLGEKIVSGSQDKTIKIWEQDRCTDTLEYHSCPVMSVCVSSSKRLIASGGSDFKIIVFDLETKQIHRTFESHSHWVRSVKFFENDTKIVSGSSDTTIKIWDTQTGKLLKTLRGHEYDVMCVRISGELILSSSADKSIRVWEKDGEEESFCLEGHTDWVQNIDICNKTVASISRDGSIRVWDIDRRGEIQKLEGHTFSSKFYLGYPTVGSLRILREGQFIVSGGADGKIKVWRRKLINC